MVLIIKVILKYDIIILINLNVFLLLNFFIEYFFILGCFNVLYVKIFGCCCMCVLILFVVVFLLQDILLFDFLLVDMVGRLLLLDLMCCLFVDWKLEDIFIGFIFCVYWVGGGIFCMLLVLLYEGVNIFVNGLSCFIGVVMIIFMLDELLLFFCMI